AGAAWHAPRVTNAKHNASPRLIPIRTIYGGAATCRRLLTRQNRRRESNPLLLLGRQACHRVHPDGSGLATPYGGRHGAATHIGWHRDHRDRQRRTTRDATSSLPPRGHRIQVGELPEYLLRFGVEDPDGVEGPRRALPGVAGGVEVAEVVVHVAKVAQ